MVFVQNSSVASTKSVKVSYGIINRFLCNKIPSSKHGTKVTELVNNFPISSAAWIFISMFTRGRHWISSWATWLQFSLFWYV